MDFNDYTDEELEQIANNGEMKIGASAQQPDLSQMSDDELEQIANGGGQAEEAPQDEGYGFFQRRADERVAAGGNAARGDWTDTAQTINEGVTPFTRSIRESAERGARKNRDAFINGTAIDDAIGRHGESADASLEGYKAKERGLGETFVDEVGHGLSRAAANLPFLAGEAVQGVRGIGRRAVNRNATDVLIDYARDADFSDDEIERAKEYSQGDPYKMYDYFQKLAVSSVKHEVSEREAAQRRMAAAGDEGFLGKVAGGTLGMIPMMEEFALTGAAGKALGVGAKAESALSATWRGRVVAGLKHSAWMTPTMGAEMTARRYKELTADKYERGEDGELVRIEGDTPGRALAKAAKGGFGEAAIFSLPIGEAAFGWTAPYVTKALRTKFGNTVANMYTNYVRYGQMTGLRGQPQMLALMDLNAFKDQVLGYGKKDSEYAGFDEEWRKFTYGEDLPDGTHVPGVLSLEGQADMFVSALGVMALQAGGAGLKAWRQSGAAKKSIDNRLQGAFQIPKEELAKMRPEVKRMLARVADRMYSGADAFGADSVRHEENRAKSGLSAREDFAKRLERWFEKVGKKIGEDGKRLYEDAGKYVLQFDNSYGWEDGDAQGAQSKFRVPYALAIDPPDENGKSATRRVVPWRDIEVPVGEDGAIHAQTFTDDGTGISVTKFLQSDPAAGDNGWVYLVQDGNGRRATRYGFKDALDAANAMSRLGERNIAARGQKVEALSKFRDQYKLGGVDFVVAKDGQEFDDILSQATGRPQATGEGQQAVTLPDGHTLYCLDRIETPQQMKRAILHEAGRHRGLDAAFEGNPNGKMGFVVGLARSEDPVVRNQLDRIAQARMATGEIEKPEDLFKRNADGTYVHAGALEEVYAHLFDREDVPNEPGWWDAHMNMVRGNLRKVFHGLPYSRAEAEEMYRGAMDKLAQQTGGQIFYVPEQSERDLAVQDMERRMENRRLGREAERDVADLRRTIAEQEGAEERAEAERRGNERLAERVQEEAREEERLDRADPFRTEMEEQKRRAAVDERIAKERSEAERRREEGRRKDEENRRRGQEGYDRRMEQREERKFQAGVAEAEAVRAAEERQRQAEETEAQRRAGYESAEAQARRERKGDIEAAIREDDRRRGEEFDRAEEERKRREAEDNASVLPRIAVEPAEPQGRGRTAPQGDVLRASYGPNGNQIVARRVTDSNGKVIGWDVNAVANDGTETLIASTTKPKKDGMAAIRAVRRQIHDHFGLPYGKEAERAMEAERIRVEEQARKETADEARRRADEEPAQPEQGATGRQEGGEVPRPVEAEPEGAEAPREGVVVHHANEGRSGDGVRAAEDALAGLFGDMPAEMPVEAPRSEAGAEGATARPERAEGAEGRNSPSGGESRDFGDIISRWGLTDPSAKFFDVNEELGSDRRDKNWELVRDIAALYDQKKIRGFYDFAKMFKAANPAWYAEQKDGLRRLWNYAAETTGLFDRVGDYEARDAIKSADEGRNVRDISGINALQAALQDIDVEMYPAAKLDSSDARVPNTKLAADPKTGIVPGNELKGRPRSLLSKPILGVEFEDGTVSVGTGRHRKELYERYGMDIPMRRVREADGWVTKKPDGTYDFTKIRLLDALDNIQDSKGSTEDYVAFFGDVKIPRAEAEREGFLGSKEARQAYAIANDATEDLRASVNFEGGRVEGKIKPEQAAAIAEIAPIGEGKANADLQRYLLKSVLRDPTLDRRDLGIKASEAKHLAAMKREADGVEQMAFDFFGDDTVEKAAEKAEKYRSEQAAKYSRLAKSLREVQRSRESDLVKKKILREDMRALGINERKIAEGGKAKEAELQKAIDKATLEKMRWESINLDPDLRAQMEKDLGMEPSAPKESETPARPDFALESVTQGQINDEARRLRERDMLQRRMDAPLKGGSMETGQGLLDLGGAEGEDLFNRTVPATEAVPAKPAFERGQVVIYKNAAGNMREATFLQDNGDGTATVRVKTPGANRYAPTKVEDMKMSLSALHDEGLVNRGLTQAERNAIRRGETEQDVRFFDANEEAGDFDKRQYSPAKYKVPGAVKSRTLLEEPPALRATEPPDNNYKLMIPERHIKNGDLQEHQLEFVGYAGRAHGMKDANGSPLGMMGGYGTGAGKSRMIAGTILDNRWRGRKRALWITTQRGLIDDVRSEVKPFGMEGLVEDIGDKPMPKDGIGFTTYSNIRNEGVVEKIAGELGKDFDGVIAFDEIHRAKTEGGRTQDAVVKLQELLPKTRVIYMSATGATDVGNLGYATRLGLWGEGTPFKDFEDFKKKVEGKGVSAMEMVAQTLKRRGQYLSANLSKEGVEFDHVAVPTTEAQKRTYTEYNHALSDVYRGVYDALEVLGRLDYTVPPSSLHGMQQRLHYSMVTALKIPALIERAKKELTKGNAPVFSLVNTNEAGSTREVAKALEEGRQLGMDEVNFGPKQILLDFLTKEGDKTYQKKEGAYKDYQFPTVKPIKDQSGEVVGFERDQIADGIRRRLVREVEKLPDTFGNPINMIIDAFGKDNVANLTGLNKGGMAEDYRAFQNGDKKVLVFSGVANTGYTFSSDRKYKNQARRVAFPLQLGYRADELEQTLGRVHRNNQANAPIYVASTTDLPGERRFYSSVERRRGQMKALTTGDRAATGNGITSEGDNFETKYAQQAVDQIIAMLHKMGRLDDIARDMNFVKRVQRPDGSVVEVNGMLKRDKSGATVPDVSAKRFLNRLLMLDPKKQDGMFTAFKNLLDQNIRWAKEDGEYDIGLQDIGSTHNDAVRSVKLADDMDVQHVNSWFKTDKVPFDDFAKAHSAEFLTYVRNKRTGETFAVRADGKMGKRQEPAAMRFAVDGTKKRMKASILDTEKPNAAYEKLDTAKAKELWDAEYGVIPEERADDGFYATGDLLKHWNDVLGSKPPRTFRVKAGDAPEYIGAKIDTDEIPAVFGRFGKAEEARDMVIDGKVREVLNNRTVDLVNGWTLKQVPRDGAKKVMVRGVEPGQLDAVAKELGGEVSKKRIFMEPDAAKLRKIIEKHPANLYRDDEKIGDTGNLRFFNEKEEVQGEERRRSKTYGVPYQGSKNRIANRIVAALPQGERFVDLFSGGGAVTHAAMESGKYGGYRMNDLDGTGQRLFLEGARGKWNDYSRKSMTPEEFAAIKGTPEALVWSFNGLGRSLAKAEEGGRDKAAEQIRRVQSLSSLKEHVGKTEASEHDYRLVKLRKGDVVYADIPYENTDTRGYRKGMEFDKAAFVKWAQKQKVPVYVSEYAMPEGWTEIASFDVPGMRGGERTEKLFVQSKFADRTGDKSQRFFNREEEAERDERRIVGTDYTVGKAKEILREDVEAKLADARAELGEDIRLKGLELHGSRVRGDARKDSDLDLVFEYDGNVREDVLFEIMNETPTDFYGIKVDINPIRADKTGTLSEHMERSRQYDAEKMAAAGRDAAYRDWLKRYGMDDTEKHREEWERKHPATKVAEGRISLAEDAASLPENDAGNAIPLSQRFNRENPDVRYFNIDEEAGRRVHAKGRDEAERMEGAGAGRREIWEKTGWWKAKDGKWRYEIAGISAADTKRMLDFALSSGKFYDRDRANTYSFTLNDLEAAMKAKGERLPDSVKTLLAAYPKLGKETIEVDRKAEQPKDGTLGYATSGAKGKIHLYERGATAETLNHELQHRIQEMSGMAGGTDTSSKSFGRYTQEHGEWEARQAATRAGMSAEERGKTAPWETADRHGVAEDMTQIDDANRARIRPDGEPKEPEPVAPAADRKTDLGDKYRTNFVDRNDPLKQMEIATGRRGKDDLYVEHSPYNAQRMLPGKQDAARHRFEKKWRDPYRDMLRKSGVTNDDVGMYLVGMNAKDRNRKVLERSGALDGAGLSDADADKMLADLRSHLGAEKYAKVVDMANFLWAMQKEGMERRVESGRVSREMADQWEKEEPHHVPMRDDLSDENGEYNRSTRQWRKSDFKEANGRYTLPDNPVEFMFKEYQDAVYGSNINEARRVLADFVRSTPGIGKVRKGVRRGKAWSFTHKQIEDFPDPNYHEQTVKGGSGRPNLVAFKEGGNLYMIELNGKQGERVAEAVIGRGVRRVEDFAPRLAGATRLYASTATELSPAFGIRNVVADMIEATLNTMGDKGLLRGGASGAKNLVNALRMIPTIRHYLENAEYKGEFADVMRRYVESGALIGGMGNEGVTELKADNANAASGKRTVKDVVNTVLSPIKNYNKILELGTRLAVFKDYIDGGASDGEAAMRSREYSTDFNKYGNQRWMNSLWMFSGSVIGGAVRQSATLIGGKSGTQLMAGLVTYGILEALVEHYANKDDDEKARKQGTGSGATMTEYQRANSLYFRNGDKYYRLPFHAGPFSVLKYAGNAIARTLLGDMSKEDLAKNLGKEALENGMHFTGTGDFNWDTAWQSITPTLAVPIVQMKANEDYTGRPIRKQMYSETKPYSENGRKRTGDVWKSMARGMNSLTGGNEKRRGLFDYSPEMYKHAWDSLGKNMTRDISTVVDLVSDLTEGKDVDNEHKPFLRDYYRDVPDNTHNFYEAEKAYKADRADGTIKAGSRRDEKIRKLLNDIRTLRHWEDGEEREGGRWVRKRSPSEATKKKYERTRLRYQQQVIDLMRPKK